MTDPRELFQLDELPDELRSLLDVDEVWRVLERLDAFAGEIVASRGGEVHPTAVVTGSVYIADGAQVGPFAYIEGPAWLGPGAQVGHAAYLRGPVILGRDAKVGHASEVKRTVLLPGARAPHFNYVGDSILGWDVNLGAGVKVANFKTFGDEIRMDGQATGLRKLGAAVGDGVSVGCNAVLSPGTVIGPRSVVYNGANVRGTVPADTVVKTRTEHELAPLKPVVRRA